VIIISLLVLTGSGIMYEHMQAHFRAGKARELSLNENRQEAADLWQQAWQLAPHEGEFAYWLSQELAAKGDYQGSLTLVKEASFTHSRFHLYMLKAKLEYKVGNKDEAIAILDWLVTGFPRYEPAQELLRQFE